MEPAKQQVAVRGVIVELFGEAGRLIDVLDDDPLVEDAAERLAFDEFAGQSVADQSGAALLGGLTAADLQFHEFARAHAGDRRQCEDRRGAGNLRAPRRQQGSRSSR
ncbi:hypothetical protein GCM10010121_043990 [Streptomyces brasiliensis]|uniref:Uncharacterized protein n=1 Tax=Streptomyces brasiliensis TaxID=1954 RepID=A0A917KVG5_9ACTN|nr:hypothetical protein GCM10010121_043990 [Streptomyces brasiliensis]